MNQCHRLIFVLVGLLLVGEASAALFASKETKAYKKHRDAARRALKAKQYGAAQTNFLAAHAALSKKGFKNHYNKGSLVDMEFYIRSGQDRQADLQDRILFNAGVSVDRIHELSVRAEALMRARAEDGVFR